MRRMLTNVLDHAYARTPPLWQTRTDYALILLARAGLIECGHHGSVPRHDSWRLSAHLKTLSLDPSVHSQRVLHLSQSPPLI